METQDLTSHEDHEERENASNMEFDNMSEEEGEEQEGAIGTQMLPQIHLHTEGLALQKPSFQRTSNPRKPHRVTKLSETIEKYNCSKCKGHKTQSAKARSHYKLLWHDLL
jgi:hypothetical protein